MSGPLEQLYFAYGSNLQLQQMAKRCPGSQYVGRAILPDYRWQINERGYANVIPSSGFSVHGLVYKISIDDEARLDRSEGVNSGAYSKAYKNTILYPADLGLQLPTRHMIEHESLAEHVKAARREASRRGILAQNPVLESNVLVYLSENYVRWSDPRDEYIDRINLGLRDATALGIPADFFETFVRPSIPSRPVRRRVHLRSRRQERAHIKSTSRRHAARPVREEETGRQSHNERYFDPFSWASTRWTSWAFGSAKAPTHEDGVLYSHRDILYRSPG